MGIIARLVGQGRVLRHARGRRESGCQHAHISRDWLQSIQSLANPDQLSGCGVLLPIPALSASAGTSTWFRPASRARTEAGAPGICGSDSLGRPLILVKISIGTIPVPAHSRLASQPFPLPADLAS
jgi:hypothetical protein